MEQLVQLVQLLVIKQKDVLHVVIQIQLSVNFVLDILEQLMEFVNAQLDKRLAIKVKHV